MEIKQVSLEICENRKQDISKIIFNSMNFGCDVEWYSVEEALAKCNELKQYIELENAIAFISIEENEINGFIWAYPYEDRGDESRIYISIVYVNENCRDASIGKHLVKAVEKAAKKKGYKKVWLHTSGANFGARKFYEKIGFEQERIQYIKKI